MEEVYARLIRRGRKTIAQGSRENRLPSFFV